MFTPQPADLGPFREASVWATANSQRDGCGGKPQGQVDLCIRSEGFSLGGFRSPTSLGWRYG